MSENDGVAEAIAAAQRAVAADVANVAAAIDAALANIDEQLASLHERRERLEATLGAVIDQIATVDGHREALILARAQAPTEGEVAPLGSVLDQVEADGEAYLEFTEEELDPDVSRTDRIVTVLTRAGYEMRAPDITDILNEFGDDTTAKVVGGTLSNLVRRGVVTKAGPGTYSSP